MAGSPAVHLTKRVQTATGWTFCPVAYGGRGHIKPNVVKVQGVEQRHDEGVYYIDWRADGKRYRVTVGRDATEAENRRQAKEKELAAISAGVPVLARTDGQVSLTAAIAEYLEETKLTKKPKTLSAYTTALAYFQESCHKQFILDIERKDLLRYAAFLRDEKGQSPRSCWNKFSNVMIFLKAQGVRELLAKNDYPKFVEEEPEVYEKEELDTFLSACTDEERVWFEFFLMTGMREQEVMHVYWSDVNLQHATVRVTHKPDRNWTPKVYKERTIPIPDKLVRQLKAWKAKSDKTCTLVFPTSGCKPKLDFLDCCKAVAERAALNSDDFYLHKFRATFCTWHLWAGVDLRTCQDWMGHVDIESTMRYLKPQRGQHMREKVNHTFAD
ncbi:MAG: hypothetical protein DMG98_13515 [Acidobacteria bacterium]|nr:MAG: hypothetical protein DMG98_13515 [Acidobacteriota bacterium]